MISDVPLEFLLISTAELELLGIRERHIQRPVHSFVTISIDGEQQVQTRRSTDTLAPKWEFPESLTLCVIFDSSLLIDLIVVSRMVRASSVIKFTVYREHAFLAKVVNNNHQCGEVEMRLQDVLTNRALLLHAL